MTFLIRPIQKWVFFSALMAFLVFATTFETQAQPCVPDCPNDQFGPQQTVIIPWPPDNPIPNCNVVVIYRERLACGWWRDIYIEDASLLSTGCPQLLQDIINASGGNAQDYITEALELGAIAAITDRFWDEYDPNSDDCPGQNTNNWRVLRGGCFAVGFDLPNIHELISVPCTDEVCCIVQYTVCYDRLNGEIDVTANYPDPQETNGCTDEAINPEGIQLITYSGKLCFPTCNESGR